VKGEIYKSMNLSEGERRRGGMGQIGKDRKGILYSVIN
jgi:hypothetical protein